MKMLSFSETDASIALFLLVVTLGLIIVVTLFYVVVEMSRVRGRETWFWFILALLSTPIVSMLCLYLLGETDEKHHKRIIQEERWRITYKTGV